MPVIDDILDHTIRAVASARTHMDQGTSPLSDSFDPFGDVNRTTLHGQGSPVGDPGFESVFGFQDNPVYTLDVFNDTPTGRPWWYDHNTPAAASVPEPPISHPMHGFDPEKWMKAYGPGAYPYSALVSVGPNHRPSTNGRWYLRPDTAAAFVAMDQAYHQDTGQHIQLASAYRNFGTSYESGRGMDWRASDHASGGAIDICGTKCSGSAVQELEWMKNHAAKFGFGVWGGNWGDDGHFSFSAGGFNGWMTNYSGPQEADKHWIALAGGQGMVGAPPRQTPLETFRPPPPTIPLERLQALVPAAQQATQGPVPEYQLALPSALAMMFMDRPELPPGTRRRRPQAGVPGGPLAEPNGLSNIDANRQLAEQMAAARGWTGKQWQALRWIVEGHGSVPGESNWDGAADNPRSSAIGIGQRLVSAHPWMSDAEKKRYLSSVRYQITWMFNYIQARYGTPGMAWNHKVQTHWY